MNNRSRGLLGRFVVGFGTVRGCAMVVEFGYIGTGGERFVTGTGDNNAADARVALEPVDNGGDTRPHIEAECVAPERGVEYEITCGAVNFGNELRGHGRSPSERSEARQAQARTAR